MQSDRPGNVPDHRGSGDGSDRVDAVSRFATWQHANLVRFADEANERIKVLESDLKAAMAAYRDLLRRQ
jgi:hypothetical protein